MHCQRLGHAIARVLYSARADFDQPPISKKRRSDVIAMEKHAHDLRQLPAAIMHHPPLMPAMSDTCLGRMAELCA